MTELRAVVHQRRACRNVDPEVFFDEVDTSAARSVCKACPVLIPCRVLAVVRREEFGIWGGMNVAQRRAWARSMTASERTA